MEDQDQAESSKTGSKMVKVSILQAPLSADTAVACHIKSKLFSIFRSLVCPEQLEFDSDDTDSKSLLPSL